MIDLRSWPIGKWNRPAIDRWADETFGRATSAALIGARANKEWAELLKRLARDPNGNGPAVQQKVADVAILVFRLAHICRFDLIAAVQKKMELNILRQWTSPGYGDGRHLGGAGGPHA